MEPKAFLTEIKRQFNFVSDKEIADVLGMTTGRVSQLRSGVGDLTARQVVSCIKKAAVVARETAFVGAIKPIVEMYPINAVLSGQGAKWELLDTAKHARNRHIREHLENARGIYLFFDSLKTRFYKKQST